jgi:hypothetical protein
MKFLLASALLLSSSAYLPADPVEVWIEPVFEGTPLDSFIGTINCSQFAMTSAACQTNFSTFNGIFNAGGAVTAQASFGSASGHAFGGGTVLDPGIIYYLASFANDVLVTGGTGKGTLIAQYQITAGSGQIGDPSLNPNEPLQNPSFAFVQGSVKENFAPALTNSASLINESLDVTSSFQFGAPFAFGAETQDVCCVYSNFGRSDEGSAGSSLQLTGFTVLDASGHVVADAQIIPGQALGTGVFTPEPLSGYLTLLGLAALLWPASRLRRSL